MRVDHESVLTMVEAGIGKPTRKTHPISVLQDGAFWGQHGIEVSDMSDMTIALPDDMVVSSIVACANPIPTKATRERMMNRRWIIRWAMASLLQSFAESHNHRGIAVRNCRYAAVVAGYDARRRSRPSLIVSIDQYAQPRASVTPPITTAVAVARASPR